jgi:hypothetical protein
MPCLGIVDLSRSCHPQAAPNTPHGPTLPAITPNVPLRPAVQEATFVALQPCRFVDTRLAGGKLTAGHSRAFYVRGTTGFTTHGGTSGGCGVPAAASSVTISITSTQSSGIGKLTAYRPQQHRQLHRHHGHRRLVLHAHRYRLQRLRVGSASGFNGTKVQVFIWYLTGGAATAYGGYFYLNVTC